MRKISIPKLTQYAKDCIQMLKEDGELFGLVSEDKQRIAAYMRMITYSKMNWSSCTEISYDEVIRCGILNGIEDMESRLNCGEFDVKGD